jgi:hypothetical protein
MGEVLIFCVIWLLYYFVSLINTEGLAELKKEMHKVIIFWLYRYRYLKQYKIIWLSGIDVKVVCGYWVSTRSLVRTGVSSFFSSVNSNPCERFLCCHNCNLTGA